MIMRTKDIFRVKNELTLAIVKTFEKEGIDPFAGAVILQAIMSEIQRPVVEMDAYRNENENIQSDNG